MLTQGISMRRPLSLEGMWWLPGSPESKTPGTVRFNPVDRITLALNGTLREEAMPLQHTEKTTIRGETSDGHLVTLIDCFPIDIHIRSPGYPTETYLAHLLLVGSEYCVSRDHEQFFGFEIRFSQLEAWMADSPFSIHGSTDEDPDLAVAVEMRHLREIVINVPPIDANVRLHSTVSHQTRPFRSMRMHRTAIVSLDCRTARSLEWCLERLRELHHLFSILIGELIEIKGITLRGQENKTDAGPDAEPSTALVYPSVLLGVKPRLTHPAIMLLPLPDLLDSLPWILNRWFDRRDALQNAVHLLMAFQGGAYRFIEARLLSLTQALESYSRGLGTAAYVTADTYERIAERLSEAIPDWAPRELKESLRTRLQYGNEHSFRRRLKELLKAVPHELQVMFGARIAEFADQVVDTRNYFTHYDDARVRHPLRGPDLHWANAKLELLLVVLILKELCVSGPAIVDAVRRCDRFAGLRHRARVEVASK